MSLQNVFITMQLLLTAILVKSESFMNMGDLPNVNDGQSSTTFDQGQTPALTKHEMFKDMYPIVITNFTSKVMKNKDPWIIVFHDGTFSKSWKTVAVSTRGVIWIGMIDQTDIKLIEHLKLNKDNLPAALVYPYGSTKTKENRREVALTANEARTKALKSLPNNIIKLSSNLENSIEDFLLDSLVSSPSKFPVVIYTYDDSPAAFFKSLAIRLEKYFNFGIVYDPSERDLTAFGLTDDFDIPSVIAILATQTDESSEPQFNAIVYNEEEMGDMDYPNLLRFFVSINTQYRHVLAGDNMSNDKTIATMSDVLKIESQRFNITHTSKPYSKKRKLSTKDEL